MFSVRVMNAPEMQGFLLGFIWFYLDFLGANSRAG
jgi:hypothetical protein